MVLKEDLAGVKKDMVIMVIMLIMVIGNGVSAFCSLPFFCWKDKYPPM